MSLSGSTLGHYEILELLGVGGMGEVYRGRDKTLDRDVAIKVLPEEWAGDGEQLDRLQRQAKVLAQLDHPNIAAIYGLEEAAPEGEAPQRLLIMQLADGETLQEWLQAGRLNTRRSLEIALQIATGLAAAHESGIVHRDLKPANVKVAEDAGGHPRVKILDFGLAKAYDPDGGKVVDKRADIWAFGVVLFEMLSGRRLSQGESIGYTLAEVLQTEPEWGRLPNDLPPRVERMLQRCLEKDPKQSGALFLAGRRLVDLALGPIG